GFNAEGGNVTLTRVVFRGNTAGNGDGGGFSAEQSMGGGTVEVAVCNFVGNSATGDGGAFKADGTTLTMSRTTLAFNKAGGEGGGGDIVTSGTIGGGTGSSIINCTLSGNSAASDGGGIDYEGNGDLTIINDTIVFNVSATGGGISQDGGTGTIHIGNTILAR